MYKDISKFNRQKNNLDWDKILKDFRHNVIRANRILTNFKSQEQLNQVLLIHQKIFNIIPDGSVLNNIDIADRFLRISNSIRENYFFIEARELGRHLLNSLMFLHGVAQSYYASQWYHQFVYLFNQKSYSRLELIEVRNLTRLVRHFDFILLSALEYLLKNYKEKFFEDVDKVKDPREIAHRVIRLINEYAKYFNEIHTINFFKLNNIRDVNLIFGPGIYYFRVQIEQPELLDYGNQTFELNLMFDKNYMENSKLSYDNLKQDFLELDDLWFEKFGYRIDSIISTIKILQNELIERYGTFFDPYEGKIPVFNIPNPISKKVKDIRNIFEAYIFQLITNYLNQENLFNTLWTYQDVKTIIKEHRNDWQLNEIDKILSELGLDSSSEFNLGENKLANHIFYLIDKFSLFFYIISYPGALRERFYIRISELDNPIKESILLRHIKRVLMENGFRIHPLSGKQIIDDDKKTLGEIDIIAHKGDRILILIESKIIPQKKIDLSRIRDFNQHMKNIRKKLKKFDKNLEYLMKYCCKRNSLHHFLNYKENEILNINKFRIVKNYFITPYLIYYPKGLLTKYTIEGLSVNLFELRLKSL